MVERQQCPRCGTSKVVSERALQLRRVAIATVVLFWSGWLAMLLLGFVEMVRVGAALWLSATAIPTALFLIRRARPADQGRSDHGYRCARCTHRWIEGEAYTPFMDQELQVQIERRLQDITGQRPKIVA